MTVDNEIRRLSPNERTRVLSEEARRALDISARTSDFILGPLQKGPRGEPIPSHGVFWSLTHTVEYVAAVTAERAVGIDVEGVKKLKPDVMSRIATADEWALGSEPIDRFSCRLWTAKEAILKANGVGLAGLSSCRVDEVLDDEEMRLSYAGESWIASHYLGIDGFVATVSLPKRRVEWHLISS